MTLIRLPYGFGTTLDLPYDRAVAATRAALADEGFGILAEIDVQATLRDRLNVDIGRYVILGACNPPLAHRALTAEPTIGLLLPCNVIVYESDEGSSAVVAMDPEAALALTRNDAIRPLATEVRTRLDRALAAVQAAVP